MRVRSVIRATQEITPRSEARRIALRPVRHPRSARSTESGSPRCPWRHRQRRPRGTTSGRRAVRPPAMGSDRNKPRQVDRSPHQPELPKCTVPVQGNNSQECQSWHSGGDALPLTAQQGQRFDLTGLGHHVDGLDRHQFEAAVDEQRQVAGECGGITGEVGQGTRR